MNLVLRQLMGALLAILAAFIVGAVLLLPLGVSPVAVYAHMFEGVFLNPYGVAQIFYRATPLIFTGLAVAFAFKAGLFNIGAEGQMLIGGFCAALAGAELHLPPLLHIPVCIAAAFVGGMAWGAIPGWLKARSGAHEVVTTIMMNFIALALTNYLVASHFHEPETVHTVEIASSAVLPRLDHISRVFHGSPANVDVFIAALACIAVWWVLWETPLGFEFRAIGLSPKASETAGIPVGRRLILAMAISGGLAGLAGTNFVMGHKFYFETGFSAGAGFVGIAVALLGGNYPIGILLAAFLFGALAHGALVINGMVPKELAEIIQWLIIIFVVISNELIRRRMKAGALSGDGQ